MDEVPAASAEPTPQGLSDAPLETQAGPLLEVELLERAVRGSNSCYAAEAFGPGGRGEVFTSPDELYHVVLVIAPAAPVALYVNGAQLAD